MPQNGWFIMERPIKTDDFFRGTPILGKHPYKIMRSWLPQVLYDPLSEDFLVRILMFVVPLIRFLKLLRHWVKQRNRIRGASLRLRHAVNRRVFHCGVHFSTKIRNTWHGLISDMRQQVFI